MEETKKKLKVYCETTFWSYLNGGNTPLEHIAIKQSATLRWWEEIAPKCDLFISDFVTREASRGSEDFIARRKRSMEGVASLNGLIPPVLELSNALTKGLAVPKSETTDASHIATSAVYAMDVLLTWNCKHMANPVTLPTTAEIVAKAGYHCPVIITPTDFLARREEFDYGD